MKSTTELLQQLNTMQNEHINTLEQQIKVISEHKQHLNKTITSQAHELIFKNTIITELKQEIETKIKTIEALQLEKQLKNN